MATLRLGLGLRAKYHRFREMVERSYPLYLPMWGTEQAYRKWRKEIEGEAGLSYEIPFWEHYISQGNREDFPYREEFVFRMDPNSPLQSMVRDLLQSSRGATVRLLDVGAGPLTCLGKTWPDRNVEITAVDPLAEQYNQMLAKYDRVPPVRTQKADAERLTDALPTQHFDLVCSRNALDHSYDPFGAIKQMLAVVKSDGRVVLQHKIDEGHAGGYGSLHQWNFCLVRGDFTIWNKRGHINVRKRLSPTAEIVRSEIIPHGHPDHVGQNWLIVVLRPRGSGGSNQVGGDWKNGKTTSGDPLQVL